MNNNNDTVSTEDISARSGCVYIFSNKVNGKCYVGQTWNLQRRIRDHNNGNGYAKLLAYAIKKYGANNFDVRVITCCDSQEDLDQAEKAQIQVNNTLAPHGYNLALGGAHGKHTDSTKQLIGSYHRNKVVSQSTRDKLRAKNQGKKPTPQTVSKIIESKKEKSFQKVRPVYLFDDKTNRLIQEYQNLKLLCQEIDVPLNRLYGSLSQESRFLHNDCRYYIRYVNDPLAHNNRNTRKIRVESEEGVFFFDSIVEATKKLGLGRGVIDSLLRNLVQKSKYVNVSGKLIFFTVHYE